MGCLFPKVDIPLRATLLREIMDGGVYFGKPRNELKALNLKGRSLFHQLAAQRRVKSTGSLQAQFDRAWQRYGGKKVSIVFFYSRLSSRSINSLDSKQSKG